MRKLYPPPRHLRGDEDDLDAALKEYRRTLERFDQGVLEKAWRRVVEQNAYWCWPRPADIAKAAEQAQREAHPAREAWFERSEELTGAYTRKFMKTSSHAARAREAGYEPEMKAYVRAAANVQAQIIAGRQGGLSYDGVVLFGDRIHRDEAETAKQAAFFERAREQARKGAIRVVVPSEIVAYWKAQAETRGRGR